MLVAPFGTKQLLLTTHQVTVHHSMGVKLACVERKKKKEEEGRRRKKKEEEEEGNRRR